jgi:hypothetical protein
MARAGARIATRSHHRSQDQKISGGHIMGRYIRR